MRRALLTLSLVVSLSGCGDDDTAPADAATSPTDGGAGDAATSDRDGGGRGVDATVGDGGVVPTTSVCAERSAAIVASTGTTIRVTPADDGRVTVDGATRTLREVVSSAAEGTTILLEDGTYLLPEAAEGSYTGLYFRTPNVTLRSASGNASAVVIDSAYRLHGGSTAPITIDAPVWCSRASPCGVRSSTSCTSGRTRMASWCTTCACSTEASSS